MTLPSTLSDNAEAATQRLVVMLTPTQKRRLDAKAKAAGISTSAYVRAAIESYDPDFEGREDEIESLLNALDESTQAAHKALDKAFAELRETRAQLRRETD